MKFRGVIGEHGPHTVRLGPDGLLYVLSGNFAQVATSIDPHSPYVTTYEGDLVQPRYEDPNGHAVGVPAPGGSIIRTDTNAQLCRNVVPAGSGTRTTSRSTPDGELFTYDADMEWDIGSPWYRPTRVVHVAPGGEYGWRSGWAKWPAYYLDSLPPVADTGAGSPTGIVYYDHTAFPPRLQNTLFVGDWALGQIHAVKLERDGATYKAKVSTFLKGRPLNVTAPRCGAGWCAVLCDRWPRHGRRHLPRSVDGHGAATGHQLRPRNSTGARSAAVAKRLGRARVAAVRRVWAIVGKWNWIEFCRINEIRIRIAFVRSNC